MSEVQHIIAEAGYDERDVDAIAAGIAAAHDACPVAVIDELAVATVHALMLWNRPAGDARSVADGILAASLDCLCGFEDVVQAVAILGPPAALTETSIGSVLEGWTGLQRQAFDSGTLMDPRDATMTIHRRLTEAFWEGAR